MTENTVRAKKTKNQKRLVVLAAAIVLLAVLGVGTAYYIKNYTDEKSIPTNAQSTSDILATQETTQAPIARDVNPLTGLSGFNENAYGKRPIAVVVENAPAARPQWGLCSPDIVIEGIVEGGITRMLWLYADVNTIPKVGPLRSARHDFVEMAEGLNAIFVHWGGSWAAYETIKTDNIDHIDGMTYSGQYFFRDKSRNVALEHTGYTNGESIAKALSGLGINTELNTAYFSPFKFSAQDTPATPAGGVCQSVSFVFSSSYKHEFKYNATDKLYYNFMNTNPMVEDSGKQMAVTNVIVLYCPIYPWNDAKGHMEMDLTGGTGVLVTSGGYENISWKKGEPNNLLKLFVADGSELKLNPGKSYIGFVSDLQGNTKIS